MPHSSGGGSHSGGSHSGSGFSSSSSSSGGSSAKHIKHTSFPGARRYVYYENYRPVYVYADYDIRKGTASGKFFSILGSAVSLLFGIMLLAMCYDKPQKMDTSPSYSCEIVDCAGVIDDADMVQSAIDDFYDETGIPVEVMTVNNEDWQGSYSKLEDFAYDMYVTEFDDEEHWLVAFYNRTGISPAVITVENSDWQGYYSDLENYAYDLYVNHFADESHWLIVYSTPDGYSSSDGFEDWYWEGMQGNDTDDVLTESVTNSFNDELQKNLTARTRYTVSSAISTSFDDLTPTVMKSKVNWAMLFTSIAILAFVCLHACLMIGINPKARKYAKAKPCSDAAQEKACEYCGYTYVVDTCTECPHCGAPIPPEDQPGHDLLDKKITA
ncbi:hypothetical protein [Ruminococcus sp.]|uniref:hypothetical protein n=1 Tax=Ruminococcus sp. TaxID=41978 RepID=UPI003AB11090